MTPPSPENNRLTGTLALQMRDGTPYRVGPCLEPESSHDRKFLEAQIANAMRSMSGYSRWLRFGAPIQRLSREQLSYLSDLDGVQRAACCAATDTSDGELGIGLARYVRLSEEPEVAEFAITVIDAYQQQGVGQALLRRLQDIADSNGLQLLRGYVLAGNRPMLALGRHFGARVRGEGPGLLRMEISLRRGPLSDPQPPT